MLNVGLMRRREYTHGIVVRSEKGEELGTSCTAGVLAVSACIAGRVAAAAPILTVPPLVRARPHAVRHLMRTRCPRTLPAC